MPRPIVPTDLVALLRERVPGLLAVYAFGSQVTGHAGADSDLDLAVLVAGYADTVALWDVAQDLAIHIDRDVDLLDFRRASTVMQHQILLTGVRWWAADVQAGLFEAMVLSEYTALNEARAPLLRDIAAKGRVYGR